MPDMMSRSIGKANRHVVTWHESAGILLAARLHWISKFSPKCDVPCEF